MNNTKHKCFISFKTEDLLYKSELFYKLSPNIINKSLNKPINSSDEDYIMRKIREEHLSDSTVTIFLIGTHSSENDPFENQTYIKRELQASLYNNPPSNTRNGILGVVLPTMTNAIYKGTYTCKVCGNHHDQIRINDDTVIKEFSFNYYLPNPKNGCHWDEDDRYCVLVKWNDFIYNPDKYIEMAFRKRTSPAANKVIVRP